MKNDKGNLQDLFLLRIRRDRVPVTMFLMNGFQMRGVITGYDAFAVVLESEGRQQLIYKHAISTIAPTRNVDLTEDRSDPPPYRERGTAAPGAWGRPEPYDDHGEPPYHA